jgi:predicted component of type VI protein secretion system
MTPRFFSHSAAVALTAATALLLAGCASTPVPSARIAVAEAAVQGANTNTTREGAPGELQVAIAKLASAQQAIASKDYVRAGQLADEAQLDAQVAQLHARSADSRRAAQESQDAARVLREEISRKTVR